MWAICSGGQEEYIPDTFFIVNIKVVLEIKLKILLDCGGGGGGGHIKSFSTVYDGSYFPGVS